MVKEKYSCGAMDALFWAIMAIFYGYAVYFLRTFQYTAAQIGTMTAVGSLLSALAQNGVGALNDRGGKWSGKRIFLVLLWLIAACMAGMIFVRSRLPAAVLFIFAMICSSGMMPLTVIICFEYQNRGIPVDYGKTRAAGSIGYAIVVYLLGLMTDCWGFRMVPMVGLVLCILEILVLSGMPADPKAAGRRTQSKAGWKQMVRLYPAFFLMAVGMILLFAFHNGTNTYLLPILERVGGNNTSLGTALAIAAVVEIPVEVLIEKILKRISTGSLMLISGIGFSLKGVIYIAAAGVAGVYVAQVLQMISFALFAGGSPYYVNERISSEYRSGAQAMMTSCTVIGAVAGNFTAGLAFDGSGLRSMLYLCLCYAVLGTAAVFFSLRLEKHPSRHFDTGRQR